MWPFSVRLTAHPVFERWLDQRFYALTKRMEKIMALLDDLTAQVARDTDVTASAVTLLRGIKAKLDAAGTDPAALKALSDQIGANTDNLANAVVENTPAE